MGNIRDYTITTEMKEYFDKHVMSVTEDLVNGKEKIMSKRSLRAIDMIPKFGNIRQYYRVLAPQPGAVIISKGWSFTQKAADEVNEMKEKGWYVMAAIQAIDRCLEYGLIPHAVCVMDPQKVVAQYIPRVPENCTIFHDVMADPAFWEADHKKVLFSSFSNHATDAVLRRSGFWVIDLPNHTVSEIMQALLQFMGAQRLVAIGVDYCDAEGKEPEKITQEDIDGGSAMTKGKKVGDNKYDSFRIDVDGKPHWTNIHYILGLQAFMRHRLVDTYFFDAYMEKKDAIERAYLDACGTDFSHEIKEIPVKEISWVNYRFFAKIIKKKTKKWVNLRSALTEPQFSSEIIADFNP